MTAQSPPREKQSAFDRFLTTVERLGNKLPEPFTLFLGLFLITGVISTIFAFMDMRVQVPGADKETVIRGLFTGEGMSWLTTTMGENYIGFPPLVTVLPILLAVGVAEKTGFLAVAVRKLFGAAPGWLLPYVVGFVGVVGSIMADSAFVVIPPLAALVFKAVGRHPVAGLIGGFAAAGAGYSTSIVPTSLDALFAGITTKVMESLPNTSYAPVNPISNYYFNIASSIVLAIIAGFIIDKVVEPRINRLGISREYIIPVKDKTEQVEVKVHEETPRQSPAKRDKSPGYEEGEEVSLEISDKERRGLTMALIAGGILTVVMLVSILVPNSPWRNEEGAFLPSSPLLKSIVFIVFAYFMLMGAVYGKIVGLVNSVGDLVGFMVQALKDVLGFLVLAFILGQFIALFNWTGIGQLTAVKGAEFLENIGLTGFPAILAFIVLASMLNLLIISGSSMWTLMAAVFVPMFALIGYEPAFVQAAFRVGDSATQIITPLNPYMIVLLAMIRRYEPEVGFGSVMARMLPFVIPFWVAWASLLALWFFLDLPLGPGNGIMLPA
ncbi:P-aminobenzoyl-glutamate transporter [Bowdeniella nasicola]|uniref:p-aminobenzoyl-glutamate transporter n=1 Tax=Bowdeniella nasicola TaxID=208480 RepID=A0A1Q5Q018_9ACTO|nr:AbgT family transporter [Bowdeniella nasicola]OKL53055.1 P-aminobenzoyl-glutamate transporter [Bowdeniella nasicola]